MIKEQFEKKKTWISKRKHNLLAADRAAAGRLAISG
jgi:hypothetical protein